MPLEVLPLIQIFSFCTIPRESSNDEEQSAFSLVSSSCQPLAWSLCTPVRPLRSAHACDLFF